MCREYFICICTRPFQTTSENIGQTQKATTTTTAATAADTYRIVLIDSTETDVCFSFSEQNLNNVWIIWKWNLVCISHSRIYACTLHRQSRSRDTHGVDRVIVGRLSIRYEVHIRNLWSQSVHSVLRLPMINRGGTMVDRECRSNYYYYYPTANKK